MINTLQNFNDFTAGLRIAGFSLGGGNDEGIYAVVPWGWNQEPPYETPIRWHTGDSETDPWEWRIRILNECDDIAYAKCFFKKSGFITQEFYPYFLALRRGGSEFDDDYADGLISHAGKRIYDAIRENGELPVQEIKKIAGFAREEKSRFDSALTELQMRLHLTICGARHRTNRKGEEYGWETTMLCTTEQFWKGTDVFAKAGKSSEAEAFSAIREQVLKLNPDANEKKIRKFAYGK